MSLYCFHCSGGGLASPDLIPTAHAARFQRWPPQKITAQSVDLSSTGHLEEDFHKMITDAEAYSGSDPGAERLGQEEGKTKELSACPLTPGPKPSCTVERQTEMASFPPCKWDVEWISLSARTLSRTLLACPGNCTGFLVSVMAWTALWTRP